MIGSDSGRGRYTGRSDSGRKRSDRNRGDSMRKSGRHRGKGRKSDMCRGRSDSGR